MVAGLIPFAFLRDLTAKSLLVMLAAFVLSWALRRSSAAARHLLWLLSFAALFALPCCRSSCPPSRSASSPVPCPLLSSRRHRRLSSAPVSGAGGQSPPVLGGRGRAAAREQQGGHAGPPLRPSGTSGNGAPARPPPVLAGPLLASPHRRGERGRG